MHSIMKIVSKCKKLQQIGNYIFEHCDVPIIHTVWIEFCFDKLRTWVLRKKKLQILKISIPNYLGICMY